MTHYGNIKSYDADKGVGTITPEKGGEALPFNKADLQQEGEEPKVDQRFSYQTNGDEGGNGRAVNLRQQGEAGVQEEQARQQQG